MEIKISNFRNPGWKVGMKVRIDCAGTIGPWNKYDGQIATVVNVAGRLHADFDETGTIARWNGDWNYLLQFADGNTMLYEGVNIDLLPVSDAS